MPQMNATLSWNRLSFALVLACTVSCSKPDQSHSAGRNAVPRAVQAVAVEVLPMERAVVATGILAAQEAATLSVKISGRLKEIPVDLGSTVKRGDAITQVEPRDYELHLQQAAAALAQARATVGLPLEGADDRFVPENASAVKQAKAVLDEATKNRDRVLSLSKVGIAAPAELDTVEASYKVALNRYDTAMEDTRTRQAVLAQRRAEFEMAKQQLADTTLRAPFDGAVQGRLANLGEFLAAGAPVVKLVQTDPLRLRLEVPERDAAAVRPGQRVRLTAEGDTNVYSGTLTRVSPAIDETARMLLVEADVRRNGSLRPGLFARAQIVTRENDDGLAVPANALVVFAGLEKVVSIVEGKALEKVVTTGRRGDTWVEIVSGLKAGENVVIEPGNLRTGDAVTVTHANPMQTSRASRDSDP
jgi:RND family efflux transporter MFP subunit